MPLKQLTPEGLLNTINSICNIEVAETGIDYLQKIGLKVCEELGTNFAMIGVPVSGAPDTVESLVLIENQNVVDNITYTLDGTPCERIFWRARTCCYPQDVASEFPEDLLLGQMGIEAYIGSPLLKSDGTMQGLFVIFDTHPFDNIELLTSLTEFIAARISLELKRIEDNQAREKEIQSAMESENLRVLGLMAGGVAHEFNNVLAGILGHAELLQLKSDDQPEINNHITTIINTAEGAKQITRKLVEFVRPDNAADASVTTSLHKVIQSVIDLSSHARYRKLSIQAQLNATRDFVYASEAKLEPMILEIVENASHAIQDAGEIVITTADIGQQFIQLSITDNGRGISPENLNRIFEPFFTTRAEEGGTGIGLASIKTTVQALGGNITVRSEPGAGTTFVLTLPVSDETTSAQVEVPVAQLPSDHKCILVVEDDSHVLSFIEEILRMKGFQVLTAKCGTDAIAQFQDRVDEIDLLFTDLNMPDINGLDLIRRFNEKRGSLKAILTSGDTSNLEPDQANLPNMLLLSKPFRLSDLDSMLEKSFSGT